MLGVFVLFSAGCNDKIANHDHQILYIDSIVWSQNLIHKIVKDTTILTKDTVYTSFMYDRPAKLVTIYIEETTTTKVYECSIFNDTLIKLEVKDPTVNYPSGLVAAYYFDKNVLIKKIEYDWKLEDFPNLISGQRKKIQFFREILAKKIEN